MSKFEERKLAVGCSSDFHGNEGSGTCPIPLIRKLFKVNNALQDIGKVD